MAKVLVFFTSTYPFGTGETFIENEIEYLAEAFDKVIIVAANTNDKIARNLPDNVFCERVNFELNTKQKILAYGTLRFKPVFKEFFSKTIFSIHKTNYLCQSFYKGKLISRYIKSLIKEHRIELNNLYLYTYWWLDEAIAISIFKNQNPQIKAFSRAHGYDLYNERNQINYLPLKNYMIQKLDSIFTISSDGKRYCDERYKVSEIQKIHISKLGTEKQTIKTEFRKIDKFTLVSCAHIYPNKRIKLIAQALAHIPNSIHIEWLHFGDYIKNFSEKYFEELELEIAQLKKYENIEMKFMGLITNKEVLNFYTLNNIDVFINVSESEGIPVSIMEAMSCGIPCMATAVGGTPEIVNNENGVLLPSNPSAEYLAEQLIEFYHYTDEQVKLKRYNAFKTWEEEYNAEKNYTTFVEQLLKL